MQTWTNVYLVKIYIGARKKKVTSAVSSDGGISHGKNTAGGGCGTYRRSSKLGV